MSDRNTSGDADTPGDAGPTRLRGAQRRIRDAYFEHQSGLFALDCNPGAGKTVTTMHVPAEELLARTVGGEQTPELHICVLSFTRDDAAAFVPALIARLRELVEHDMTPAATAITAEELGQLIQRTRDAPFIGTIDSLCRALFSECVGVVGFDEMPTIGTDAHLGRIHADCYDTVTGDPGCKTELARLEAAYPPDTNNDGPADLLRQALHTCRARRLTTTELAEELHATLDAVYTEGNTTSFDDIAAALARCVDAEASVEAHDSLDTDARERFVAADSQLHAAWQNTVESFISLLDAYREEYASLIRREGVISHTDCAYLVAEFLAGNRGTSDRAAAKRARVLARYRSRIESVVIDEAQDVSELHHAVLTQLLTEDCRVLAAGDLCQSIYGFRDAHPSLFDRAVTDGQYAGIDWDTHVTETAATTYRCAPDVAAAINAIAGPALTDSNRGNLGDIDVEFAPLDAAREPVAGPNVHIAAFESTAAPGTPEYVAPDTGKGEAGILATYIAAGLEDGTLTRAATHTDGETDTATDATGHPATAPDADRGTGSDANLITTTNDADASDDTSAQPDVTVLFRWRTRMPEYAAAFEAEGLTVANASNYLFDSPTITAVLDVADWLIDPADSSRLKSLVTDSNLGLQPITSEFEAQHWDIEDVYPDTPIEVTDQQRTILKGLHALRKERAAIHAQPVANTVEAIVEHLALRADPHDHFTGVEPAQRVANLDAFTELIANIDADTASDLTDTMRTLASVRNAPHRGPKQPPTTTDPDVVFKTIHQAKGSESDVVALADLGWSLRKLGPTGQRFIATGPMIGLAPPVTAATQPTDALPVYTQGLYNPDTTTNSVETTLFPPDVGLRWASEHWIHTTDDGPESTATKPDTTLAGHDHVQTATRRTRAEAYRILFVALTRSCDHLVVPLPRDIHTQARPRDRWLEPIRNGLQFDGTPTAGTYTLDVTTPSGTTRHVDVAVNAVNASDVLTPTHNTQADPQDRRSPFAATTPTTRTDLSDLVPRFLQPTNTYQVATALDRYLLDYLQNRSLQTDTTSIADHLPLTLNALGPDAVGTITHDVLTGIIANDLPATALRNPNDNDSITHLIDTALDRHGPPATSAEAHGVSTFLTDTVLPAFAASQLWTDLHQATEVYIEKPLRGHIRRNGVEFELEGYADFVLHNPDDSWTVADVKTTLTPLATNTRRRYELQLACYAALLANEPGINGPIQHAIETFGATTQRIDLHTPHATLDQQLDDLFMELDHNDTDN